MGQRSGRCTVRAYALRFAPFYYIGAAGHMAENGTSPCITAAKVSPVVLSSVRAHPNRRLEQTPRVHRGDEMIFLSARRCSAATR